MRPSVLPGFMRLTADFEGGNQTNFLYLDVLGLVTTAFGVLVDPLSAALACPWRRPDGTLASHSEIVSEWSKVKQRQDLRLRGGMAFRDLTTLRLDEAGVQEVVGRKLDVADRAMAARFRCTIHDECKANAEMGALDGWPTYPADAQLFALSMCWAIGPAWPSRFPRCAEAFGRRDFLAAAQEAHISEDGNPGIKPRNKANLALLRNAHVVSTGSLHPDRLWWPRDIWEEPISLEDETLDEDEPTRVVTWDVVTRLPGSIAGDDEPDDAA